MTELSATGRTRLTRAKERGVSDRVELLALLREGLVAHIGVTVADERGSHPVVPGRAAALRPNTRKELAATSVLAVPLHEASLKTRAGGPVDDQPDIDAGYWAGHLPLRMVASPVVPDPAATGPVPQHVQRRAADFA